MVRSLNDSGLDASDRKLLSSIERVGWHVVMVPEEGNTPGWAFSVGLFQSFSHPEVVVFGLPLELSGQVINSIGEEIRAGKTFEAGSEHREILDEVRCTFRHVNARWYRAFLGASGWYYRGPDFPALQCIWPDRKQNYPWEPGFDLTWLWAQPLLFEAEPEPARVVDLLDSVGGE